MKSKVLLKGIILFLFVSMIPFCLVDAKSEHIGTYAKEENASLPSPRVKWDNSMLTIISDVRDARIYYTLDGVTFREYNEPIKVESEHICYISTFLMTRNEVSPSTNIFIDSGILLATYDSKKLVINDSTIYKVQVNDGEEHIAEDLILDRKRDNVVKLSSSRDKEYTLSFSFVPDPPKAFHDEENHLVL